MEVFQVLNIAVVIFYFHFGFGISTMQGKDLKVRIGLIILYVFRQLSFIIIMKRLDPLRAKKTFIRKKLGHTMVSAIKASSVTL